MNLKAMRAAALKAAQDILAKAKAEGRDTTDDERTEVEAKFAEIEELDTKIKAAADGEALLQKLNSLGGPGELDNDDPEELVKGTVGERFIKSPAFKQFRQSHPSGIGSGTPVRIEAKNVGSVRELLSKATITTQTGNPSAAREPGYRNYLAPDDGLTFLDLITTGQTDVSYSEYAQVIAETNNAAVVPEGELKPESDVTTELQESKAFTYADGFSITNQTLSDDGALAAFMESRIRRHVLGVIEQKIFNGTGAGTEPLGIMNTTGTLAQAFDTDVITTLARALATYEANNDSDPQAIVMNSSDVWALRLLKDGNGRYLFGDPLVQGPIPTPWGVPLVTAKKLAAGTALVGRFDSVHYLELDPIDVQAFNQHADYAKRNMAYVRAEARGRQLFYAPREVVVGDLTVA